MLGVLWLRRGAAAAAAAAGGRSARAAAQRRAYSAKAAVEATEATFEREVLESPVPTVVDFYADWCGPCRMLAPILERAVASDGRVRLAKVNVDHSPALAADYGVSSLPTVVGFRSGKPVAAFVGMRPPQAVGEFVAEVAGDKPGPPGS
ncbi:hypothetical protein H4R18_004923 [Coemansia javaensis]|uniref:Thioredoxin domain-containing protein n=1 Tax=Coemansia javaensis TaxID=2761396 RepID=A0A9W8LGD1_9FUNG|nr:hypothetical protein H4R18_004923 [Coemansia javaensis]